MKSAYDLAMERLTRTAPTVKLTAEKKQRLAELDSRYAAKIAEREIALGSEIAKAGEPEKADELRQRLLSERKKIQAELEEKKERVRQSRP